MMNSNTLLFCKLCRKPLVKRTNRKTKERFWGCSGYPRCNFTRSLYPKQNKFVIYVLKQQEEKYYVGKSIKPFQRINDHFEGRGSAWTKKYPPIYLVEKFEDCDNFDEDKITKMYMEHYGIDNVRGGSYSQFFLPETTKMQLQKEIWGANDQCFICGGDHFVKDCTQGQSWCFLSIIKKWIQF